MHVLRFMLMSSLLVGCAPARIEQQVTVEFPQPRGSEAYALFDARHCSGDHVLLSFDPRGHALIKRIAERGRLAVQLQSLSLCEGIDGGWRQVWNETLDPPDRLAIACHVDKGTKCRMTAS